MKRRDPSAVAAAYGDHHASLERAAKQLGFGGAEAADLVHAVWTTFLDVVPRFEGRSTLRTFLFGILRREARSARRRATRASPTPPDELDAQASPHDQVTAETHQLAQAVEDCVGRLGRVERQAVELKLLEQRATDEVRNVLGVSANYLGVLLHRARAHLRHCLSEHLE